MDRTRLPASAKTFVGAADRWWCRWRCRAAALQAFRLCRPLAALLALAAALAIALVPPESAVADQPPVPAARIKDAQRAPSLAGDKVAAFFQRVERARSIDEVRTAYTESRFSPQEAERVAAMAAEPRHAAVLARLQAADAAGRSGQVHPPTVDARALLQRHAAALEEGYRQELAQRNRAVQALRAAADRQRIGGPAARAEPGPALELRPRLPGGAAASITSVVPTQVRVGQNLTIRGAGFGRPGRAVLLLGGRAVDCERIVSWTDEQIVVTVPATAGAAAGEADAPAIVWVQLATTGLGPTRDIGIAPDPSQLVPEITRLSGTELLPEQTFLLQGRNFLAAAPGSVELHLVGKVFPVRVDAWQDHAIEVRIPNIIRILRETGWLVVRNHLGLEARAPVTFVPRIVAEEIRGPEIGIRSMMVSCSPYQGQRLSDDPRWLICIFGASEEHMTRIRLRNGWVAVSAGHHQEAALGWTGAKCGAYHSRSPVQGSTTFETTTSSGPTAGRVARSRR